jgi:hypothetical protein
VGGCVLARFAAFHLGSFAAVAAVAAAAAAVQGYFSFDLLANECSMCVPNAVCPGGAVVWPAAGFFHSAPQSMQMHRCGAADICQQKLLRRTVAVALGFGRGLLAPY